MTFYEELLAVCDGNPGKIWSTKAMRTMLKEMYGRNGNTVLLSDFSYNRTNHALGPRCPQPLFRFIKAGQYKYLGPGYPYTGEVLEKRTGCEERVVGHWRDGVFAAIEQGTDDGTARVSGREY